MKTQIYYESKSDKKNYPQIQRRIITYEMPSHFHENMEMMYILRGTYSTVIDNTEIVAHEDDIVFVPSFYIHSGEENPELEVIYYQPLTSNTVSFQELFKRRTLPFLLQDKDFNRSVILPLLEYFCDRPAQTSIETVMQGFFDVLCGNLTTRYGTINKTQREQTNFLVQIMQYIGEHYRETLTLESVATKYGYSKFYFSKLFNKLIGMSFSDYVNLVRVQQFVKHLSKHKEKNIMYLARKCGFKSQSSFYRAFHEVYGIKPSDYFSLNESIYW